MKFIALFLLAVGCCGTDPDTTPTAPNPPKEDTASSCGEANGKCADVCYGICEGTCSNPMADGSCAGDCVGGACRGACCTD